MEGNLYNQPVVIDNGSGNLKAGFAGEDKPKTYASAIVGRPKYPRIMTGSLLPEVNTDGGASGGKEDTFIGNLAQEYRGLLRLNYPISHGIVENWEDMELIWNHTYQQELKINSQDHPLLITEAPLNPRKNRDKMSQILFESFSIPCIYISIQAVLSLYSSGRTTGVVIDSGDGISHIVPVYEGFSLPTSIKRLDIGGRDITEQLGYNLRRMIGVNLTSSSSEFEILRIIKENCCFISKDPIKDEKLYSSIAYSTARNSGSYNNNENLTVYKLPDGKSLPIGVEKFRSPEILFNPQLIGNESAGIHDLITLAIGKTDLDLRPILYQNLILSGGNTLLKNFGDRLLLELKNSQYHQQNKMKIKIYAPPERKYSTWIGGSILAGLSTFKKMWITHEEYQENPDIVHIKCL
ncbi:centractin actin-related protein of the dynactin complex [Scheffersomyces amazonensis]|uniref:centractin actin-related protein of the dynactin complex n=1 Tax=Scheffersomyces amazonensis TaxID=1078765 RepID=UPI00315C9515